MNSDIPALRPDENGEIFALIDTLVNAEQRLEELTAGEVDSVLDSAGRRFLLRGAREQLLISEADQQAAILNSIPANIALLDHGGRIIAVNGPWRDFAAANQMQGHRPGYGVGLNYLDICDAVSGDESEAAHSVAEGIRSVLGKESKTFSFEYPCDSAEAPRWFMMTVTPLAQSLFSGVMVMHEDITSRKDAEVKLRLQAERLSLATSVARVGVWEWDPATGALTWDATMFEIYGLPFQDSITYEKWTAMVHPEDLQQTEAKLGKVSEDRGDGNLDFRILRHDGSLRDIAAVFRVVLAEHTKAKRVIGVNVDVTGPKASEEASRISKEQLTRLAEHDFLTGLPNRRLLNDRIGNAIELGRRHGKSAALLFLDIDGFKHINDSLGHSIGDKLIRSVADRLAGCVRASDTVSRQGGDEYIVLLSEVTHPEDTVIAAKRLMEAVAKPHQLDHHELHVTTCIGVSVFPHDGPDAETLIKNADTAMYQAKENGRPSFQFFEPEMNVRAVERQSIEENLRRALERKEFALQYQPKINIKTGAIVGAEALLRWTHPARGSVSPAQFIPVAEDSGLILPIGNWVLHEACRQTRAWLDEGLPAMTIAVNVSGLQFMNEGFVQRLFAVLDETRLDPKYLEVEITESILMKNVALTSTVLNTMRDAGIKVALDDFGTGYSSLSYLYKFPIDVLKIDQSFVRQITATADQTSIVNAIIGMGQSLNLSIVAEGVETLEQLEFLRVRGCDEAQGYYFSRPVPPQQFAKLFETRA